MRDAPGLAKELEWRVKRELSDSNAEDGEVILDGEAKEATKKKPQLVSKKKPRGMIMLPPPPVSRTWNFSPT